MPPDLALPRAYFLGPTSSGLLPRAYFLGPTYSGNVTACPMRSTRLMRSKPRRLTGAVWRKLPVESRQTSWYEPGDLRGIRVVRDSESVPQQPLLVLRFHLQDPRERGDGDECL